MEFEDDQHQTVDRLRSVVDNERLSGKVRSYLEDDLCPDHWQTLADDVRSRADAIREQISALESQADQIETQATTIETVGDRVGAALEHLDELDGAEGRDEKQAARAGVFGALQEVIDAFEEAEGLDDVDVEPTPSVG